MEREMDNWNDDRLDELSGRMDGGFAKVEGEMKEGFSKVDQRFERVEGEMKEGFSKVDQRFERVDGEMKEGFARMATKSELHRLADKVDRLQIVLIGGFFSLVATLLTGFFVT